MARKAFNWSLLDRDMLYSMLHNLKPEIVDKRLTIGQFTSLVSKHIKTLLPVKVTTSRFAPVRKGEIWIGGAYHSYLDNAGNKRFIENAPENVVNNEKKKEADIKIKIKMLELKLKK